MKSLSWLTEEALLDSGARCDADPSMDIKTVHRRTEAEGISFLTITLPAYCQGIDNALASGTLEPSAVSQFHWHRRGLPVFLRGFLLKIFSPGGKLLPNPCKDSIICVRQVLLLHKKIELPCNTRRMKAALRKFRECEHDIQTKEISNEDLKAFATVSRVIWSDVLSGVPFGDPRPELIPKHGPGATAERVLGNAKYSSNRWHRRLNDLFPFDHYGNCFSVGQMEGAEGIDVDIIEPEDELPVRVVFVPKTLKTPRVIAIEPVCMQYVQQALLNHLVPLIEKGRFTGGRVNFSRQDINKALSLSSSKDGRYATIDLSEASDRVSLTLVNAMLSGVPIYRDLVMACRSTRAELPDGDIITLSKFASMGSALCFPMEAMAFFCAIVTKRLQKLNLPPTGQNVQRACSDLYIYGDDIIVPTDEASSSCDALEAFSLKVNRAKSFWTGKFRESCGVDAYDGQDVTPTYCRRIHPAGRHDAMSFASWVSMANQFYMKGFWKLAKSVRSSVEKTFGRLPFVSEQSQGLGWKTYSNASTHSRWSNSLMRFEERAYVLAPHKSSDPLDGVAALLKCLSSYHVRKQPSWLTRVFPSDTSIDHLDVRAARGGLTLKRRWILAS